MRSLNCPNCVLPLRVCFVAAGPASPIELDRCSGCGRFWFDGGELERASGRTFISRMRGTPGTAQCIACQGPTHNVLLNGEILVEECEQCRGMLLEPRDIELISGKPLAEAKPPPPIRIQPNTSMSFSFNCDQCQKRVDGAKPRQLDDVWLCQRCESAAGPIQPIGESARRSRTAWAFKLLDFLFDDP